MGCNLQIWFVCGFAIGWQSKFPAAHPFPNFLSTTPPPIAPERINIELWKLSLKKKKKNFCTYFYGTLILINAGFRLTCRLPHCRFAAWSSLAVSELQLSAATPLWLYHRAASLPSWIEFNCLRSAAVGKAARLSIKVGVNPSLKRKMWLTMHLITKKTRTKMYKSIHFWNQKNQMNPMVATDFCKIMRFSRNSSVTMVTIKFFLESITKIWFY